jgi:hypothetical protein
MPSYPQAGSQRLHYFVASLMTIVGEAVTSGHSASTNSCGTTEMKQPEVTDQWINNTVKNKRTDKRMTHRSKLTEQYVVMN